MGKTVHRAASMGLAFVLMLSVSGVPRTATATADERTEALRELQAELDALFAPDPERSGFGAWAASIGAPMQAAGPVAAPVVVTSIALVEANADVTLEWADVGGVGAFEVLRDGKTVTEVGVTTFVDTVPADVSYVYEIRAIEPDDSRPTVGITTVAVSLASRGCDFTWTGAVDGDFADADNWSPIGAAPAAPSVPKDGNHICIDSRQNTPVTSTESDAGVGTATTSLDADADLPPLLAIAGGDFTVSSQFNAVDLAITGGSFASTGTTSFRLLNVADGELVLNGNVTVSGGVEFGPGTPLVRSSDGAPVRFNVGRSTMNDATLTLDGPVELAGIQLEMNGASAVVPGGAGSTMTLASFVPSGAAQIDVSMSGPMTVVDGAALTITNHQAIAANTRPPQMFIEGTLTLTQPVRQLGNVDLFGVGSAIELNGGSNVFAGLEVIDNMTLDDAIGINVPNDLSIRSLSMNSGATFTVDGELAWTAFLSLSDATITASTVIGVGTGLAEGDIDVFGTANRIVGDVTAHGTIRLASDPEVGSDAKLVIDGGLTLGPDSFIDTSLTGSDVTGRLAVRDAAALDGALLARITGVIPADTDVAAISWGTATGTIGVDIAGNTDNTTIEQKPGGVFVRRDGGGPGLDVTAVVALGMFVDVELGTQVTVGWPAIADTDKYVVVQDGVEVGETTGTTFVADVELGKEVTFSVIAVGIEEDQTNVGSLTLALRADDCTIAWTGAIDDAWSNPLNWLPISEDAMPSPRTPESADDVCVDVTTNTPVIIDGDVSIDSLTSEVPPGGADPLIDIEQGDVAVGVGIDVPGITVRTGSVTSATLVADELVLGNAVVDAANSDIRALRIQAFAEFNDAELFGAATIERVTQAAGTTLRIEDLQSPATTVLDLAGATTLDKSVAALGELYLFEAGTLSAGGSADNVLDGLTQVGALGVQDTIDVTLPENIVIGDLTISDAFVEVSGDLNVTGRLAIGDGADLSVGGDATFASTASIAVTSTTGGDLGRVDIGGTAVLDGSLTVDLAEPVTALPFITWPTFTGSFATTSLSGAGADGTELVVGDSGVSVEPVIVGPPSLIVLGIDVGTGVGDPQVALAWPAVDGAAAYEVRRDGEVVATVTGTTADITSEAKRAETLSVWALDDAGKVVAPVGSLQVFAGLTGCDVAWTGAISDAWDEPLNWTAVIAGGVLPANAVPAAADLACVQVDTNLPIQVTSATQVGGVLSFSLDRDGAGLAADTTAIEITDASFTSATGIATSGVAVDDATLSLGGDTTLEGELVLDGATVELQRGLDVEGAVRLVGASSVFDAQADDLTAQTPLVVVTGNGAAIDADLRFTIARADFAGGSIVGGPLLSIGELFALSGQSAIGVEGVSLAEVTVAADAVLRTERIGDLASTSFTVEGRLELVSPGAQLDALTITGADAEVVVDDGAANVLTGITAIDWLSIDDAQLAVPGSITTRNLDLVDAALVSDGNVATSGLLAVGDSLLEAKSTDLVDDPDGIFDPRILLGNVVGDTTFTITGDLALTGDTTLSVLLDAVPAAPLLSVDGGIALDGLVRVSLDGAAPAGTDQPLITWGGSTGTAAEELIGTGADSAVLLTTATGVSLQSIVPLPAELVAYGIELGEKEGDPSLVSLTWPTLAGATSYEIRRNGDVVAATTSNLAVVDAPSDEVSEFTVVGIDDAKPLATVGTVSVLAVPGCDAAWTGAIDDVWTERLNWAPVVFNGQPLRPMSVPAAGERGCIGVETNLPVRVDTDVTVGSLWAVVDEFGPFGFAPGTEVVAVDGAELTVDDVILLASVTLTDATLSVGIGGTIYGDLTTNGATIEFGDAGLDVAGTVRANGPFDRFVSTSANRVELEIDELIADTADITVIGDVASIVGRAELDGSIVRGGSVASIDTVVAVAGMSVIELSGFGVADVEVAAAAQLAVPTLTRADNTAFVVAGRLALAESVESIGELTLDGADAVVALGTGRDNDLTGVTTIGALSLAANDVTTNASMNVNTLLLSGASIDVNGTLTTTSVLSSGLSAIDATLTIIEDDGVVTPGITTGNLDVDSTLAITGDLVLPSESAIALILDQPPVGPSITVSGAATLAGEATVSIEAAVGDGSDIGLIRWGSATGTLTTRLVGGAGDPEKVSLVQRDAGLFLVSGDAPVCGAAPKFAGMDVDGCWVDQGDDTYTATRIDNVDGVAIGGIDLGIPTDDTTVTIDTVGTVIRTSGSDGEPAVVAVSVPVTDGTDEVARIGLGTIAFDDLVLGGSIAVPLDELLGFPVAGTPTLTSGDGAWSLQLGLDLPGLLRTAGLLDVSIGSGGILSTDLSLDDLSAVFAEIAGITDLDIDWADASTWLISTTCLNCPSITGDIDFDELDGGGTLSVRDLRVDDVLVMPDFDLTGVFTDTTRTWVVEQPPSSVLRRFGFAYTTDGELLSAEILLGDVAGESSRASVASWGDWLDIDAFELTWNGVAKIWDITGRLTAPEVAFTGSYAGDGDGATQLFELDIDGAELGPFATFDLELAYDGDTGLYEATAVITRDAAPPIDGAGSFRFVDGDLGSASLTFESIVIGELLTIEDFRFTYERETGTFALGGELVDPGGASNEVFGSLTFEGGKLRAGQLRLDSLEIGPIRFDEFAFDFARTVGDERLTSATISGHVQAGSRVARPVSGTIEFVDGSLTLLDLQVGTIDLGGIAQIEDVTFGYTTNTDGTATIGGSGQLVTSDGATDTPVLVEVTLRDGQVVDGRIEADVLSFARAITIENFTMVNSPITPGTCAAFTAPAGAQQWQVTGQTTSNGETTSIDGCLVIDGPRLVAGELELGNLRIGGLLTIENLLASFEQEIDIEVPGPDGDKVMIRRTDMSLSATARVGDGAPKSFSGSASFANGGLTALALSLPEIDLMNVVKLRDVEFSYIGATPWDRDIDTTFSLSGSVVGENSTSSFGGDIVFGEDGEVETLSIDAEDIDFGIFRIDVLSFLYDSSGDQTEWALSGQVEVAGRTSAIVGQATVENGRVIAAQLTLEEIVIGDLAVIDTIELSYARNTDGSEEWSGSASITTDDGKTNAVALGFAFDADGALESGFVEIARLEWSELLVFEDVRFAYVSGPSSTRWDVSGSITLAEDPTVLSGFLELEAGRATAGELVIQNLRIGEIATIERLSLSAEVSGATTTWAAEIIIDNDKGTTGSGSMTWSDGRLVSAQLQLADLRFSQLFTLSELSISLTAEEWSLSARFENRGENNLISSTLEFDDGRLVSAELNIQELSFGDVLVIDEFTLAYESNTEGASWRASATVTVADRTTSLTVSFDFAGGQLQSAQITIGQLSWGEAIVMDDVTLTFDRISSGTRWTLTGAIIIKGETTSLSGFMEFSSGRLVDGELTVTNLRVGALATIDELSLTYQVGDSESRFDASITFADGSSAVGYMVWVDGRLDRASLDLSDLDLGQSMSMFDAAMGYDNGNWTFDAFFSNDGNEVTIRGGLVFDGGRLVDGTLSVGDVRLFGVSLTDFALVLGDSIDIGGGPEAIADVCGVTDPGGPGDVYGISANILNDSGEEGSLGGRLRVDDGAIADGVLCATNINIGEIITIDDLLLRSTTEVAQDQVRETWNGAIELSNPADPSDPFRGSFEWVVLNGSTRSVEIAVSSVQFSDLLDFEDVEFSYSRTTGGSRWAIAATLNRPDSDPGVSGFIELDGNRVVTAEISITDVSFGNVVSLNDLTMTYVGRRAQTSLLEGQFFEQDDRLFPALPVGGCSATPNGSNVPSGTPTTSGPESYFRISANVSAAGSTFAAAGSIGFVDGRMSVFDVSISCVPLGDWFTLEDVRIGTSAEGDHFFQAGVDGADASDTGQRVSGLIGMDDGRVTGGNLFVRDLSLGFVEIRRLDLTLGQQPDGTSTWGATVQVNDPDGGFSFAGGGSVTLDDRKVIGGTIELPDLPLLDLLPVRDVSLGFDRQLNGDLGLEGGATFVGPDGSDAGFVSLQVFWRDGALTSGSLRASSVELFDVIEGSQLNITYDRNAPGGPRWSGSMSTRVPGQASSKIQMGFDVINGRLDSGILGFDGNADGVVDTPNSSGAPPATGNGELGGFPLKALYLRYCSADTSASFCADVNGPEWDGRLKVQLPTDNAPSLDARVTIRDGRFVRASMDLEFSPGIMIFSGVFLDSIGASLELDPRLRFCGSLGASVGAPALPIARIEGGFEFSEGFSGINSSPRSCSEPPVPFNVPDGAEADYYRFLIEAEATLFPNNPLGIDLSGSGYLDLWTSGYLGLGAEVSAGFWGNKLAVSGEVRGSVFDANNIVTTNPKTGQRLRGVHAQLSTTAGVTVLGYTASANFLVNTIGWSGCANTGVLGTRVGVSGYWSGGFALGCGISRVQLIVPGTTNVGSFTAAGLDAASGAGGFTQSWSELDGVTPTADTLFDVGAGEEVLGIVMRSAAGTPNTLVISPTGTVYVVSNDFGAQGPVTFTDGTEQIFMIDNPPVGTWTVRQVAGSPTLVAVETYLGLPAVDVSANLQQAGGELSFDYSLVEVAGQAVSFVERDSDGATINLVGRVETAAPTDASAGLQIAADPTTPILLESLQAAGTRSGTFAYRTNAAAQGGEHQLVALVEQDGLPRQEVVLATYTIAPATRASAPTAVAATATTDGASVRWAPPTDDGGRQIMAYHVSSQRGFIVAVDGDARTAELPIPLMTPGENLEVYVQALTAAGPGATGAGTFVATASTGPTYVQAVQPQSFVVGSEPMTSPSSTPVLGPNSVPTVVVPPVVPPVEPPVVPRVDPPVVPRVDPPAAPTDQLPSTGGSIDSVILLATLLIVLGVALRLRSSRADRRRTRRRSARVSITS